MKLKMAWTVEEMAVIKHAGETALRLLPELWGEQSGLKLSGAASDYGLNKRIRLLEEYLNTYRRFYPGPEKIKQS